MEPVGTQIVMFPDQIMQTLVVMPMPLVFCHNFLLSLSFWSLTAAEFYSTVDVWGKPCVASVSVCWVEAIKATVTKPLSGWSVLILKPFQMWVDLSDDIL